MAHRAFTTAAVTVDDAPWWARWVLYLASVLMAAGGIGGLGTCATLPSRMEALETRLANESSYLRGEIGALQVQMLHSTCLDEWADDPGKDRACNVIKQRAADILESQTRNSR